MRGSQDAFNFGDDLLSVALLRFLCGEAGLDGEALEVFIRREWGSLDVLGSACEVRPQAGREIDDILRVRLRAVLPNAPRLVRWPVMCAAAVVLLLSVGVFRVTGRCLAFGNLIRFYASLHLIHYKGGGYLAGRWRNRLVREYLTVRAARLVNPRVRIVGTGMGLGPFKGRLQRRLLRAFLGHFDALFVRERESLDLARALCPRLKTQCLGDDVLLLVPLFESLRGAGAHGNGIAALNLKDFPDHQYDLIAGRMDELLGLLHERGLRVEFFSFGRHPGPHDVHALEQLDLRNKRVIEALHDPYEEGFDRFLANLGRARFGLGFAYHFVTILAMMNAPPVAVYAGDYYGQKIKGAAEFLDLPFVFDLHALEDLDLRVLVDRVLQDRPCPTECLRMQHLHMVREYTALYRELLPAARRRKQDAEAATGQS